MEQATGMGLGGAGYQWIASDSIAKPETWQAMSSGADHTRIMKGLLALTPSKVLDDIL